MIPKTNGNGEMIFTPRQVLGWIALIGVVAGLGSQWALQSSAIQMIDYRLSLIEDDMSNSGYVTTDHMNMEFDNVDTKLDALQSDIKDLKNQISSLERCEPREGNGQG